MATKRENGIDFPAEAFAFVPDSNKPSEWKLRLWEDLTQKVTRSQLGAAAAALSPGGFRGNRVQIPTADVAAVKKHIRSEYAKLGVKTSDMPAVLTFSDDVLAEDSDEVYAFGLSYNDLKALLASNMGVDTYSIKDFTDSLVVYYDSQAQKLYGKSYTIANGKVTFGTAQSYVARTTYEPVSVLASFSLEGEATFSGDEVLREGKLFEIGDYPDKGFAMDEADADAAIMNFQPVDNDLEHTPTMLSGKLGQLREVWRKGKEVFGKVAIPKWLHDMQGGDPIKVSLAFDRSKRIIGNALVLNPRVGDAQLVAAFSAAHNSPGGEKGEHSTMPVTQKTKVTGWWERFKTLFTANDLPEELKDVDPDQVTFATPESKNDEKQDTKTDKDVPEKPQGAQFSDAERSELTGLRAKQVSTEAERFADAAVSTCKAFPAERESLVTLFTQAALDDNNGTACFSADGALVEGKRVKALRDGMAARPAHTLTKEQIAGLDPKQITVLSASGGEKVVSPERKAELLVDSGYKKGDK